MKGSALELQKISENFRLTAKQERAILEMVNPATGTLGSVAKTIGVSERTLYAWLKQPAFEKRLREERANIRDNAVEKLKGLFNTAIDELGSIMASSASETARLRACQIVLDYNLKLEDLKWTRVFGD